MRSREFPFRRPAVGSASCSRVAVAPARVIRFRTGSGVAAIRRRLQAAGARASLHIVNERRGGATMSASASCGRSRAWPRRI